MIRYGETTEANLIARGLMLPAAQAGPSGSGRLPCNIFREGSILTGDAFKGGDEGRARLKAEIQAKREAKIRAETEVGRAEAEAKIEPMTEPKTEPFGDSHDEIAAEPEAKHEDFADFNDEEDK